jgi:hypothetical protein
MNGDPDPDIESDILPNRPTYPSPPTVEYRTHNIEINTRTHFIVRYTHQDEAIADYTIRTVESRNYILRVHFIG